MLRSPLIHPPLLRALAAAGHGSRVLLADANYPMSTAVSARAEVVWLNVAPSLVDCATLLGLVTAVVPVEGAAVMDPAAGAEPDIFGTFRQLLPGVQLDRLTRAGFYQAARGDDLAVAVATGERRLFGNVLLTVGVVPPDAVAPA